MTNTVERYDLGYDCLVNADDGDYVKYDDYEALAKAHTAALEYVARARDDVIDHSIECVNAMDEYDQKLCCDGHECGCQGSTVHDHIRHHIIAIRTNALDTSQMVGEHI